MSWFSLVIGRNAIESPAGDQFWKFSRQCSIFGRIGDQWVAILSPVIFNLHLDITNFSFSASSSAVLLFIASISSLCRLVSSSCFRVSSSSSSFFFANSAAFSSASLFSITMTSTQHKTVNNHYFKLINWQKRSHVAMRLFITWSQMTSKMYSEQKKVAH